MGAAKARNGLPKEKAVTLRNRGAFLDHRNMNIVVISYSRECAVRNQGFRAFTVNSRQS